MKPDNVTRCFLWTPGQIRPELYESHSFFYVSKIVVAVNSLSAPVSVIGNGLVLVVMLKTRSLHTTANIFIGSLVLADFMVGAVVQTLMVGAMMTEKFSYFGNCLFVDSFSYLAISIGSISAMTMGAVSCERYIALFFPMRYTEIVTNKRAYIAAFSIWIGWFGLCSLPLARSCPLHTLRTVGGILMSALCMAMILFSYVKIFCLVRRHRRQIQEQVSAVVSDSTKNQIKQTKLAITTSYVIGTSLVCYFPASIVLLMFVNTPEPSISLFNTFFLVMSLQLISSCVNPVIYCWRSREIRQPTLALVRSFKEKVFCC